MVPNSRLMAAETGASGGMTPQALPKDGSLEVALAIQKASQLVTVDPTQDPFMTKPADLFLLAFDHEKVGINDAQMVFFKAALTNFLPEIAVTIAAIPEDASQVIGDVRRRVRLALLGRG